jgi:hypothetical protein
VWKHGWGSEAWKHGRDSEASEARHRAMLMARYSIILGLERLYKPTTWSVEWERTGNGEGEPREGEPREGEPRERTQRKRGMMGIRE